MNMNEDNGYSIPVDADPITINPIDIDPINVNVKDANTSSQTTNQNVNQVKEPQQAFRIPEDSKLKQCKYCRVLIPKDAKICPNCKQKIKKSKIKTFFISLFTLALCFVIGFGIYYYRYNISNTFSAMIHAANNKKPTAVAEVPTSPPTAEPTIEPTTAPVEESPSPAPSADTTDLPKLGAYKDMAKEDFMPLCVVPDIKSLLRNPDDYKGLYVKLNLKIEEIIKGTLFDQNTYYLCVDTSSPSSERRYLLRDVRTSGSTKLLVDDSIDIYGQFFSLCDVPFAGENIEVPAIDLVFSDLTE